MDERRDRVDVVIRCRLCGAETRVDRLVALRGVARCDACEAVLTIDRERSPQPRDHAPADPLAGF